MDKIKTVLFYMAIIPAVFSFWAGFSSVVYFFDDISEIRHLVLEVDPNTGLSPHEAYMQNMAILEDLYEIHYPD